MQVLVQTSAKHSLEKGHQVFLRCPLILFHQSPLSMHRLM